MTFYWYFTRRGTGLIFGAMQKMNEDFWTKKLADYFIPMDRIAVGPGEDCVHLTEVVSRELVISVDAHIEGVHFNMDILDLRDVGHRSLALALSDLASVGATPITYLVNLEVPDYMTLENVTQIYEGFKLLNTEYCISPSGGNLVKGDKCGLTITVVGETPRNKGVLRSGAKEGDLVLVTGDLGRATAGLNILLNEDLRSTIPAEIRNPLISKFKRPWPRIKDIQYILGLAKINAAIDITDGLGRDLNRVAQMSDVEIVLKEDAIPTHPALVEFARKTHADVNALALGSGEELEVAFTMSPDEYQKIREIKVPIAVIGEVRAGFSPGVFIKRKTGEEIPVGHLGYDHIAEK